MLDRLTRTKRVFDLLRGEPTLRSFTNKDVEDAAERLVKLVERKESRL